jgi:hypothetical protein
MKLAGFCGGYLEDYGTLTVGVFYFAYTGCLKVDS